MSSAFAADFDEMTRRWDAIERGRVERWNDQFASMHLLQRELQAAGRWVRGPEDLMGVLRLGRDEVRNCRVLAWLFDPLGAHGLGDRFLRAFLETLNRDRAADGQLDLGELDLVT